MGFVKSDFDITVSYLPNNGISFRLKNGMREAPAKNPPIWAK